MVKKMTTPWRMNDKPEMTKSRFYLGTGSIWDEVREDLPSLKKYSQIPTKNSLMKYYLFKKITNL